MIIHSNSGTIIRNGDSIVLIGKGGTCLRWDCGLPDPQHSLVWRCPRGHRTEALYCAAHAALMTERATQRVRQVALHGWQGGPICSKSTAAGPCYRPLTPVLEGWEMAI